MNDKLRLYPDEFPLRTGGVATSGEHFQHDADLAREAGQALNRAMDDRTTTEFEIRETLPLPEHTMPARQRAVLMRRRQEKQRHVTGYLSGTEREIGRARFHSLCGAYGFFDRDGMEKLAVNEALRKLDRRGDSAQGYVVMMVDLGGLGRINDEGGGHAMGDHVLMQAAEVISGNTRETDLKGMYGGDEYIIVIPMQDEAFARKFMETGYVDERGSHRLGRIDQIQKDGEQMRRELRETFPDFPNDRLDVKKGHFPGRLSVGWHYVPEGKFLELFREYQLKKTEERQLRSRGERVQDPVTFLGMITREADSMLYEVKQRDVREALSPGAPQGIAST